MPKHLSEYTDAELRGELHARAQKVLGDPHKGVHVPVQEYSTGNKRWPREEDCEDNEEGA